MASKLPLLSLPSEEWGNCPYCFVLSVIGTPCMSCCPDGFNNDTLSSCQDHLNSKHVVAPFCLMKEGGNYGMNPFRLADLRTFCCMFHRLFSMRYDSSAPLQSGLHFGWPDRRQQWRSPRRLARRHHVCAHSLKWCENSCMQSDESTSGDMSSDGPQNSNVTAMSVKAERT